MSDWYDDPDGIRRPAPGPDPTQVRASEPGSVAPNEEWFDEDENGYYDYETGQWVDWQRPPRKGRRILLTLAIVVALLVFGAGAAYSWVQRQIDPPGPPGDPIEVVVPEGATTEDIGRQLADAGVIASSSVWNYWMRLNDEGPFQAGFYVMAENSSFREAIDVLDKGPKPPESTRITIPEGFTLPEIVARLVDPEKGIDRWDAEVFQTALESGDFQSKFQPAEATSMEGILFPETYEVGDETDERAFLRQLVNQLDATLVSLDVEARSAALGITPYEAIILASLIEEEARIEGDRTKISRVIHNRLVQGIPLGIDATNRYEAELAGRSRDDIDFSSDSPYNTRRVRGLPPTPIASPGRASLDAALNPADGPWTFYVLANAEGEHFFTDSNAEFLRAKEECRKNGLGCG